MENASPLIQTSTEHKVDPCVERKKGGNVFKGRAWLLLTAAMIFLLQIGVEMSHAATLIPVISYDASSGLPASPWGGAAAASYVTTVNRSIINDGGREVLRVYDPGLPRNDSSTPKVNANSSFSYTISADQHLSSITQGWVMKITMKLPSLEDPSLNPTISPGAWGVDSNHWVGYYFDSMVPSGGSYVRGSNRYLYALMFGRAADGRTIVRPYNLSSSFDKYLSPDYHEYAIVYQNGLAKIYVDGDYWMDYTGFVNTPDTGATRMLYWGDNNSQPGSIDARSTYYQSFSFEIIPEPSRGVLMMIASIAILFGNSRGRTR